MRRIVVVVVVGVLFAAEPAGAAWKSVRGTDFDNERGRCDVTTRRGDVVATCDLDEGNRVHYQVRLPREATHVRVRWDRRHRGCCGFVDVSSTRWGTWRRHLVMEARVRNYGNPLGSFTGVIRRVELRYWRPPA